MKYKVIAFSALLVCFYCVSGVSGVLSKYVTLIGSRLLIIALSWHIGAFFTKCYIRRFKRVDSTGKSVLVTGCDSGFGQLTAFRLNEIGFNVYAGCLFPDGEGAACLTKYATEPNRMHVMRLDITSDRDVDAAFEAVQQSVSNNNGQFYGLVNNAGVPRTGETEWGQLDTHFRDAYSINALGPVRVTRRFLPLIRQSKGRVINITSVAGRLPALGTTAYSMSKAAVIAFTDGLRIEMDKFQVKVIEVEPMFYRTPIIQKDFVRKSMDRVWEASPAGVKEVYGERYYAAFKKGSEMVLESNLIVNSNPAEVVEAIEDALCSPYPENVYRCADPVNKLTFWFAINVLPLDILELIMKSSTHLINYNLYMNRV